MNKCTGIMGRLFGHQWAEYGPGMNITVRQVCLYLHIYHYGKNKDAVPRSGFVCQRCGCVSGEQS